MKTIATAIGIAMLQGLFPGAASAQTTQTTEETQVNPDGSVTKITTTTFTPDIQKKVVTYFDPYKTEKFGVPAGFFGSVKVEKIPMTWRTTRITPGLIVTEPQREFLVAAPPPLVKLLPPPDEANVRYYVAGSNVIAVDDEYKVVDSIHVPSIKIEVDD